MLVETQKLTDRVSGGGSDAADDRTWMIGAGAFVVLLLWFGMVSSSFWLDESGTWWIVKDGPAEAVRRAFSWSGQSPLYYLIAWLSSRVFGLNEIALRLPSVLAIARVPRSSNGRSCNAWPPRRPTRQHWNAASAP